MATWTVIPAFATVILLGAMSPGPDFAIVVRRSAVSGRRCGLLAAEDGLVLALGGPVVQFRGALDREVVGALFDLILGLIQTIRAAAEVLKHRRCSPMETHCRRPQKLKW